MVPEPDFPIEVNGWQQEGEPRVFDRRNVFAYMDGAGELYLAYDFRRLFVQEYGRDGGPRIVAEVYEMATSQDAYGVFSHDPEGEDVGLGQGDAYAAGLLRLWQGRYFFRILAERDTPAAKTAVVDLGRTLAEPVAEGSRPALLDRLPRRALDADSVRYFHTHVTLNSIYYLADENLLGLSSQTEAVLGVYRPDGEKITLLLVRYLRERDAREAYREFDRVYLEDEVPAEWPLRIAPVEDGRHVGALLKDRCLVLALDARSRAACEGLLSATGRRL